MRSVEPLSGSVVSNFPAQFGRRVGHGRYEQALHGIAHSGEPALNGEMGWNAAAPQVVIFRIPLPPSAERQSQEPERIDDIRFAAVVLADKDRQFAVKVHRDVGA
jgi:hypothetical protein